MERKPRILVIDDEKGIRDMIAFSLTAFDYSINKAIDGVSGLESIKSNDYDLVLTDMKMPVFDGIMLLAAVKQIKTDIEIIIMSGFLDPEAVQGAYKLGLFNFLNKPFDINALYTTIKEALYFISVRKNICALRQIKPNCDFETIHSEYIKLAGDTSLPVITIGKDNIVIDVNPAAATAFNKQKDMLLGVNAMHILMPYNEPQHNDLWNKIESTSMLQDIIITVGEEPELKYMNLTVIYLGSGFKCLLMRNINM